MLIRRYLFREITHTFFAVILVVLLIAISNRFIRLVAQAASGSISPNVLFEVILFQIPELLAFLLPVAMFLAILLCYSRFFAENEIPVMLACGISWQRLMTICVGAGLMVMIIAGALTCFWAPKSAQYREQLLHKEGPLLLAQTLAPGRFHLFHQDRLVFYVSELNDNRTELTRIFIAEHPSKQSEDDWSLISAAKGKIYTDQNGLTYFMLMDGQRYQGTPGKRDYSIVQFESYQQLLEVKKPQEGLFFHRTMPTKMLIDNPTPGNMAELQWRLSIPLAAPLLALLALPLSRVAPRSGRFGRLFVAIIVCILYFNLLTLCKRAIASGTLSPWIGVWWVHLLLLLFALIYLAKTSGRAFQSIHWLRHRIYE
ncbi:MAG: LPS export ABC transporter permease LptF [Proteobacteria bacterium]|nr:LPS export ABC transporter permease LptF [Pseudomonadota bacterium]